ncbi:zinc-ribbon domain-containing protein [Dehalogenimonas formicexedens]|uniref:Zinc-ribbon domain-containing protein n=1 Tax=Dehalogenimonas formicexedens TaxID=1839801 RepID=A0A1P8F965_9CHLR|nr:zinc ribbon domain-containing protein [Dehalogenimonas formicexedens]APV45006.1 zinc-ribbon domain-containing protein [Dehalogenimonas formicexedens]
MTENNPDEPLQQILQLILNGRDDKSLVKEFKNKGIPEELVRQYLAVAHSIIEEYKNTPEYAQAMVKASIKKMITGALWAIGGGIVTALTYSSAGDGGTYVVFWGAIIFGIYDILRGLFGWIKYSSKTSISPRLMNFDIGMPSAPLIERIENSETTPFPETHFNPNHRPYFCTKCGKKIEEYIRYCPGCGTEKLFLGTS